MGASTQEYSVQLEASNLFQRGILRHTLISPHLPQNVEQYVHHIRFVGRKAPSLPFPWRWAESISALKALEAVLLNRLVQRKYGSDPLEITIDTDHALLFVMGTALAKVVETEKTAQDKHGQYPLDPDTLVRAAPPKKDSTYRLLATNIYRTKDGRYYHTHGSLNATPTLSALDLPLDVDGPEPLETSVDRIQAKVLKHDSSDLDILMNHTFRQAGTVAYSGEEYFATAHGRANARKGLYEIHRDPHSHQSAAWWPEHSRLPSSTKRPLAGLRVVDLTRVIAGPTITRSLAEMGASVMRVTAPHLPDQTNVHRDLNWGKWNCHLDLREEGARQRLRALIVEADVVVDGYRPGAMEKLGFGRDDIFNMVKGRDRGIIHLRENCYGWYGPWQVRSGWQGISDACCGVSVEYGKAMGLDEAVTPPLPNSDHCTGAIGSAAILQALVQRAEEGGSHGVDVALNWYSQWLVRECGLYPPEVWAEVWSRHGSPVFRHYDNTRKTVPAIVKMLETHDKDTMLKPEFFATFYSKAIDASVHRLKPVTQFKDQAVDLGFNVGTRGNGVDQPWWPDDLGVEIVT